MGALIPGFPARLAEIPPAPFSADDPDRDAKRAAYLAWRGEAVAWRVARQMELVHVPRLQPFERMLCANSPAYFMATWLTVFEPRRRRAGAGRLPFLPFAAQVEAMEALIGSLAKEDADADVIWSKVRGWGASWIGCVLALWGWLFSDQWPTPEPWNVLMVSRKFEFVDSKQQKSLFAKLRRLIADVPPWMMPEGFDPDHHVQKGFLLNPANLNEIGGESTNANTGRGDRVTWAWVDEAAFIPDFQGLWSTIADTTDHRWGVSTESVDEGPDFYNLRTGDGADFKPFLIESEWWENPLLDDAWLAHQRDVRFAGDPDKFQQEIMRNPYAGQTTWVYPWAWELAVDPDVRPRPGRHSYVTIDPGFDDATVLIAVQEDGPDIDVLGSYANSKMPADFYVPLLKPSLFGEGWEDADEWTWDSTKGERQAFVYEAEALAFARLVDAMGGSPTFVGDTYGDNVTGATADSVYSRFAKYGVFVNRDRRGEKDVTAYVREARTFKGRREALNERMRRLRFADTRDAGRVLDALKKNRYRPQTGRPTTVLAKTPLHDGTSHYVTAMEFLAVHMKYRNSVEGRTIAAPVKSGLGQLHTLGSRAGGVWDHRQAGD